LRKNLKIKATFIFIAWAIIFAHSVIPHNHCDDSIINCCASTQKSCPANEAQGILPEFMVHHSSDIDVCHLSGFLFHQLDHDNLISDFTGSPVRSHLPEVKVIQYQHKADIREEHLNESASLRAPPMA